MNTKDSELDCLNSSEDKNSCSSLYNYYVETNIDAIDEQPIDFSKKYDNFENSNIRRSSKNRHSIENREVNKATDDEVKIYHIEGTPLLILSSASSFCDLRYSIDSQEKSIKDEREADGDECQELSILVETTCESYNSTEENDKVENENFERSTISKVSSPLMFSRSSSLGSLHSFEQNSIRDDQSSVSIFSSTFTSGIISPSDIPDSPGGPMSPFTRKDKHIFVYPPNKEEKVEDPLPLTSLKLNETTFNPTTYDDEILDDMKVYNEEGDACSIANLSVLSFQTHSSHMSLNKFYPDKYLPDMKHTSSAEFTSFVTNNKKAEVENGICESDGTNDRIQVDNSITIQNRVSIDFHCFISQGVPTQDRQNTEVSNKHTVLKEMEGNKFQERVNVRNDINGAQCLQVTHMNVPDLPNKNELNQENIHDPDFYDECFSPEYQDQKAEHENGFVLMKESAECSDYNSDIEDNDLLKQCIQKGQKNITSTNTHSDVLLNDNISHSKQESNVHEKCLSSANEESDEEDPLLSHCIKLGMLGTNPQRQSTDLLTVETNSSVNKDKESAENVYKIDNASHFKTSNQKNQTDYIEKCNSTVPSKQADNIFIPNHQNLRDDFENQSEFQASNETNKKYTSSSVATVNPNQEKTVADETVRHNSFQEDEDDVLLNMGRHNPKETSQSQYGNMEVSQQVTGKHQKSYSLENTTVAEEDDDADALLAQCIELGKGKKTPDIKIVQNPYKKNKESLKNNILKSTEKKHSNLCSSQYRDGYHFSKNNHIKKTFCNKDFIQVANKQQKSSSSGNIGDEEDMLIDIQMGTPRKTPDRKLVNNSVRKCKDPSPKNDSLKPTDKRNCHLSSLQYRDDYYYSRNNPIRKNNGKDSTSTRLDGQRRLSSANERSDDDEKTMGHCVQMGIHQRSPEKVLTNSIQKKKQVSQVTIDLQKPHGYNGVALDRSRDINYSYKNPHIKKYNYSNDILQKNVSKHSSWQYPVSMNGRADMRPFEIRNSPPQISALHPTFYDRRGTPISSASYAHRPNVLMRNHSYEDEEEDTYLRVGRSKSNDINRFSNGRNQKIVKSFPIMPATDREENKVDYVIERQGHKDKKFKSVKTQTVNLVPQTGSFQERIASPYSIPTNYHSKLPYKPANPYQNTNWSPYSQSFGYSNKDGPMSPPQYFSYPMKVQKSFFKESYEHAKRVKHTSSKVPLNRGGVLMSPSPKINNNKQLSSYHRRAHRRDYLKSEEDYDSDDQLLQQCIQSGKSNVLKTKCCKPSRTPRREYLKSEEDSDSDDPLLQQCIQLGKSPVAAKTNCCKSSRGSRRESQRSEDDYDSYDPLLQECIQMGESSSAIKGNSYKILGYRDNVPDGTSDIEDDVNGNADSDSDSIQVDNASIKVNSSVSSTKSPDPTSQEEKINSASSNRQVLTPMGIPDADSLCVYETEDTPFLSPTPSFGDLSSLSFAEEDENFLNNSRNSDCNSDSEDNELLLKCIQSGMKGTKPT